MKESKKFIKKLWKISEKGNYENFDVVKKRLLKNV